MIIIKDSAIQYEVPNSLVLFTIIFTAVIVIAFYVLRSIGLYKLAKNNGYQKAFIAFIPCVWIWLLCKMVGEYNIFGMSFKKYALLFCIICSVVSVVQFAGYFLTFFPLVGYYFESLKGVGQIIIDTVSGEIYTYPAINNYFDTPTIRLLIKIFNTIGYVGDIFAVVIQVFAFINLFKKFWPEHYIIASVLSVFGFFGPFVFAVRNRKAVNYAEYMRNRYYYNNPYGPNPYGGNDAQRDYRPQEPFSEYDKDKKENDDDDSDPFSEFNNKNK